MFLIQIKTYSMFSFFTIKKKNRLIILIHVCAWIVYSSYIYLTSHLSSPKTTPVQVLSFLLPFIATFYITLFCLGLNKEKGIKWSIASFFIVFFVMATLGYIYIYQLLPLMGIVVFTSRDFNLFLQNAVLGYVQYFAYAMLYFYVDHALAKERQLRMLQEEKARVERQKIEQELENAILKQQELKAQKDKLSFEYAFLRAQINPHFLHNTLNVLYSRALDYSSDLAEIISKLSRMMRYSLEAVEYESDKVFVQKELDNLQLLLEINNIRFHNSKVVDYTVEGEVANQMLPPLSMITIVENAFKYGDLTDLDNCLKIKIKLEPRQIYFYCRNKKKQNNIELSSHNIGITNLSKRLDISFKGKYEIKPTDEQDFYTFELTVNN